MDIKGDKYFTQIHFHIQCSKNVSGFVYFFKKMFYPFKNLLSSCTKQFQGNIQKLIISTGQTYFPFYIYFCNEYKNNILWRQSWQKKASWDPDSDSVNGCSCTDFRYHQYFFFFTQPKGFGSIPIKFCFDFSQEGVRPN